jgi:putative pyruvate formate lyase activating enzyme
MLELQANGCHNINWVTPEHVVPQILEALPHAIRGGLRLSIVAPLLKKYMKLLI